MMDISNMINGCNYGSMIKTDSVDSFKHPELIESLYYNANGNDPCMELQVMYNIKNNTRFAKGSSYEYTINPSISNIQQKGNVHHNNDEHFDTNLSDTIESIESTEAVDTNFNTQDNSNVYKAVKYSIEDKIMNCIFYILVFAILMFCVVLLINKNLQSSTTVYYITN
jgi:hypothetical protein